MSLPENAGWALEFVDLRSETGADTGFPDPYFALRSALGGLPPDRLLIQIDRERLLSWGHTSDDIDAMEFRVVDFSVTGPSGECGKFVAKLRRVRDPDLETLARVGEFLSKMYGGDSDRWPEKRSELYAKAELCFSAGYEELNASGPVLSTSKEDRAARKAEFDAWQEQVNRGTLALLNEAYKPLEIAGRYNDEMSEIAISLFRFSEIEKEILDRVPDNETRLCIERMINEERAYAYAFGRWVREGEIIQSHGPLVETGVSFKASRKKAAKAAAEAAKKSTDNAWRNQARDHVKRIKSENPKWGATKIAKNLMQKMGDTLVNYELATIKAYVEKWNREEGK
jgi:hypothetical protein